MKWDWLFEQIGSLAVWQILLGIAGILVLIFLRRLWSQAIGRISYFFLSPALRRKVPRELFISLIRPPLYAITFTILLYLILWAFTFFQDKGNLQIFIHRLLVALLILWIAWLIVRLLSILRISHVAQEEDIVRWQLVSIGVSVASIVIFLVAGAISIQYLFQINVTSVLASLGIGGLAVALAAQETLEQFLGAITILADQPFKVGQFIRFQNIMGKVERIGLRSTRIRTLDGILFVVPNKQLVDNPVENFTETKTRRILVDVGLIYSTPLEVMEAIKKDIETYFASEPALVQPQFVRFAEYADSSLTLRVLTYVKVDPEEVGPEKDLFYWQDQVNKKILEIVRRYAPHTDFAFPTRTLYVAGNEISKV